MTTQKIQTLVAQTKINRLNQTQFDNATGLENNEVYAVDPQFTGGKLLATDSNGDIVESNLLANDVFSRNIGEIVQSTIPLTDAGLHLLDGSLLAYGSYQAFIDYIADLYDSGDYTAIFDTEANWQSAVTTYGVCGKFVYDSVNNTVRLPKYNSKIYTGGGTAPVVGNGITIGLTDGVNNYGMCYSGYSNSQLGTAYSGVYGSNAGTSALSGTLVTGKSVGLTTDGDKSGIIAQLSDITTSLEGYYYIVIATTTKTDIQVDIDEIATDLNGKADTDLSNVPNSKGILTESYINGTSWYRVYSDGWCEQGGYVISTGSITTVSLLKPYRDTNYWVSSYMNSNSSGGALTSYGYAIPNTTTDFLMGSYGANFSHRWHACGYIR